ncbi:MAG: SDR family NAD(P)-dependent oxidoreductase [Thermoleophilia bacterium]|nr:SDR family NAD(P)-dependent oxidoreductase [Thermoleophilia bacterium]
MTVDLRGKVVVVTGASLGIGRATAFGFAAEGARLVLSYHEHEGEARAVAEHCGELGAPEVVTAPLDLGDEGSVRAFAATVLERFEGIDILVNNAGIVVWRRFVEQELDEIETQVRVNLLGTLMLTRLLLPGVRDAVIDIASTASLHGSATLAPYGASKWGLRGFTKALAKEHPELRLYNVHPAVTATRMNDFKGMDPARVAEVIVRVARGGIALEPGADVDLRDFA